MTQPAPMRLRLAALLLILSTTACHNPIGEEYSDADAITSSEFWQDWVIIGSFGVPGPFQLVDIQECEINEPCHFSHNAQNHTYDKFYGYRLKVLTLKSPDGESSHVVLRSKEKYPEPG